MGVFPAASSTHVPAPWATLMSSPVSITNFVCSGRWPRCNRQLSNPVLFAVQEFSERWCCNNCHIHSLPGATTHVGSWPTQVVEFS
jgi:hypothetical protein